MKKSVSVSISCVLAIVFIFLLTPVANVWAGEVKNEDKSAKGEWDFKIEKAWTAEEAGDKTFTRIQGVYVADNGMIFVQDGKHKTFFSFKPDGSFVKQFGKQGEGPGEVKALGHALCYVVGDKFVVVDDNQIEYYSMDGVHVREAKNQQFERRPFVFLDEDRFLTAPLLANPKKPTEIRLVNLKTGDVKVLTKFEAFKGGAVTEGEMTVRIAIRGLTPTMMMGYGNGRVYYGMNDHYKLDISDKEGKKIGEFSVNREAKPVSRKELKKKFKITGNIPEGMVKKIISQLPDKLTFFSDIQVVNGMVYVFPSSLERKHTKAVDIFSADGKYLYKAVIEVEEGSTINDVVLKSDGLYLGIEDEDGNHSLNKYKINLPAN